jgi:hypothetical protein
MSSVQPIQTWVPVSIQHRWYARSRRWTGQKALGYSRSRMDCRGLDNQAGRITVRVLGWVVRARSGGGRLVRSSGRYRAGSCSERGEGVFGGGGLPKAALGWSGVRRRRRPRWRFRRRGRLRRLPRWGPPGGQGRGPGRRGADRTRSRAAWRWGAAVEVAAAWRWGAAVEVAAGPVVGTGGPGPAWFGHSGGDVEEVGGGSGGVGRLGRVGDTQAADLPAAIEAARRASSETAWRSPGLNRLVWRRADPVGFPSGFGGEAAAGRRPVCRRRATQARHPGQCAWGGSPRSR